MVSKDYTFVGIDISKLSFDACINGKVSKHANNKTGFDKFVSKLPANSWCVMESTGTYCYKLADCLFDLGFTVSIVNPLIIKRYSQMLMMRTKTDSIDAKLIAAYGQERELIKYKPVSDGINELRQCETVLEQLIKQRTALENQTEAMNQMPRQGKQAVKSLAKVIRFLNKQISEIEQKMKEIASKESPQAYKMAKSVVGIGDRTTSLLIAITQGFTMFETSSQIVSYIGVCPRIKQSGTSVKGKAHICKLGLSHVRSVLYMCAISASIHNNACKKKYQAMIARGKAKKVALLAIANKLLRQVFACVSKNVLFDNNFEISFGN